MSACWGGVSRFFSRSLLFEGNSSMLVCVDDVSLVIRQFFGVERSPAGEFPRCKSSGMSGMREVIAVILG